MTTTNGVQIQRGDTLWGIAKQQLQQSQGEGTKITNQQIIDAMRQIAKANGYESGDYNAFAHNYFNTVGSEIQVPGLSIEHGQVTVQEDEPEVVDEPVDGETEESVTGNEPETDFESGTRQNVTTGAVLTLGAKAYVKRNQIKNMPSEIKGQYKSAKTKAKATADKAKAKAEKIKAQQIRNNAAAKIKEARKAKSKLEAEQKALEKLKKQQAAARKKLKQAQEAARKAPLDKAKRTAKNEADKEFQRISKQIEKQKKMVDNAKKASKTAKAAAKAARKQVTKSVNKAAGKATGKAATKAVAKTAGKAAGKTLVKKIPIVGLVAGVAFAADRALHGDWAGAAAEVASGAASCVPGVGTAVSVAIDVGLGARDLHDEGVI